MHIEDYIPQFVEELRILNQSPATIESYEYGVITFAKWIRGEGIDSLQGITKQYIELYQFELNVKEYSVQTVHLHLRALRRFFEYLEKHNVILLNPTDGITLPSLEERLPQHILTEEEVEKLMNAPDVTKLVGIRNRAVLEVLYSTAIRREECVNLKVTDVELNDGLLRVTQGKGGKGRVVPLGTSACHWLDKYLTEARPQLLRVYTDNRMLFIGHFEARPITKQMLNLIVKQAGRAAGIQKPVTPHSIRRTCATHLLRGGANPLQVQRILGHSCARSMNRYIKVSGRDLKLTHGKSHPREK